MRPTGGPESEQDSDLTARRTLGRYPSGVEWQQATGKPLRAHLPALPHKGTSCLSAEGPRQRKVKATAKQNKQKLIPVQTLKDPSGSPGIFISKNFTKSQRQDCW